MVYRGQFGVKKRTRQCWYDFCDKTGQKEIEIDSEIFTGRCPRSYNTSEGGLCLAYHRSGMNHSTAKHLCEKDGRNLIDVSTQTRYDVALKYASHGHLFVQGQRLAQGGPYFNDAGKQLDVLPFFNWTSGEPSNRADELYLRLDMSGFADNSHAYDSFSLCEIRQ